MKKIVLLMMLILSGCCTAEKYKQHLNSMLGMSENELIERLGNPTSVYDTPQKRSLEYNNSSFVCGEYGCNTWWCSTQFMIRRGRVDRWSFKGNNCCSF